MSTFDEEMRAALDAGQPLLDNVTDPDRIGPYGLEPDGDDESDGDEDDAPPQKQPAEAPTHVPCCSAHGVPMTCARYRRTHFVEVRPCCAVDAEALR